MKKPNTYNRSNRVLYIFAAISLMLFLVSPLGAQIERSEFDNLGSVEFINYEGPHSRIETRAQIRSIGYSIGQIVKAGTARTGALGRYFVIHSVSEPDGFKLDADIFGLGPDVGVDHIRNMRLIIQGYLEATYDYDERDAALLAEYITIYNAVYRGDMEYFDSRYKNPVMDNITMEKAGLSIRYDEWPGQTLMLIPLGTAGGPLSSVDTSSISDFRVVEQLRQEPDMALDQRRDMVDLKEREADEAGQQAAISREAIQQEEQRIAEERRQAEAQEREARQEQQRIAEERQQPGVDQQALDSQEQAAAERALESQQQQEELDRRLEALEEQRQEAERQETFAEQKSSEAQEERQQIAEDQQAIIMQEIPPAPAEGQLAFSILNPDSSLGRLVKVEPGTGSETLRSPLNTVNGRTVSFIGNRVFAVAGENRGSGAIRLVEINAATLQMLKQGDDDIVAGSQLWVNGQDLYAIINTEGNNYLGRFNSELALQNRSTLPVHPFSTVLFIDDYLAAQKADGSVLLLNPRDLTERR